MFAWIGKRVNAPWNRKTRWTPLLLNQREFQRALAKERSRVERDGNCFGFIILRLQNLNDVRRQSVQLAKLLHRRLRDSDEKGHLGVGRIGVMLPSTGSVASEYVLEDLLRLARLQGLAIEGEAFVYPDQESPKENSNSDTGAEAGSLEEVVESKISSAPLAVMIPAYPSWKRALDITGASIGLLVSSPILLLMAGLIKLTSGGPVIFKQRRTGYLGEKFEIYKLRTMVCNAEELKAALQALNERDGPAFKMKRDPRITTIGRFLRATGLDELPQLLNVLRGEMSLVGPRPLPIDEAAECNSWQRRRMEVKPGITCFWQIAKSRQISFVDWMRLDLQYARSASFKLDIKLITKTFASVFLGRVGH